MEGDKGWSVHRSSSLPLLFPPHGFSLHSDGSPLAAVLSGISFWSGIGLHPGCLLQNGAFLLCCSWCSLCWISLLLFPLLSVWLFLSFFTHISLEIPPALLMDSVVFCGGFVAELLTSFPRGHLCVSSALPPMPDGSRGLSEGAWDHSSCRWGWLGGSCW